MLADPLLLAEVGALQEVDAVDHAVQLLARDVHGDRVHAAGGDHHRVVARAQLVEGHVPADLDVVVELAPCLATQLTSSSMTSRGAGRRDADQRVPPPDGIVDVDLSPSRPFSPRSGRRGHDDGHASPAGATWMSSGMLFA